MSKEIQDVIEHLQSLEQQLRDSEGRLNEALQANNELTDKRLSDNKYTITTILTALGFFTLLFTAVLSMNLSREIKLLDDFKKDTLRALNVKVGKAELVAYGHDEKLLQGQVIEATFKKDDEDAEDKKVISVPFLLKNIGDGTVEGYTIKLFTTDSIQLRDKTAFNDGFIYEQTITYKTSGFPANKKLAHTFNFWLFPTNPANVSVGRHIVDLHVYYGEEVIEVEFEIEINSNPHQVTST